MSNSSTIHSAEAIALSSPTSSPQSDPILCQHCLRTANNGIKCKGKCVADDGY